MKPSHDLGAEFLFDFASPNSYMCHKLIPAIEERTGVRLAYRPVFLGGLFKLANNRPPFEAFAQVPSKIAYERLEMQAIRFLRALAGSTKPLVAAVNGRAVGVGTTMLLHCDFVVLVEDALLSTPFVNLPRARGGFEPAPSGAHWPRPRIRDVRLGQASCRGAALAWGIANRVVPVADLHRGAYQVSEALAKQAAGSLKMTKMLMRQAQAVAAQMDLESAQFAERLRSPEAREAFTAFAQKRPADFSKLAA